MALALIALLVAVGSGAAAVQWRRDPATSKRAGLAAGAAGAAVIIAGLLWLTRPGLAEIEDRVAAALAEAEKDGDTGDTAADTPSQAADGALLCSFLPDRSRVTSARADDVALDWNADGCVNGRTQYGLSAGGEWSRVLVLEDEAAVAVNTYDPATRTFRTDRYLLGQADMAKVVAARGKYTPPACQVSEAARTLGEQQSALVALLPDRPNERLVFDCVARQSGGAP